MKAALHINHSNHTIEMNKAYAKKAQAFGSDEYNDLVTAGTQFPTYKFVIKEAPKKRDSLKGLTYEYMEKYIQSHNPALMDQFNGLRYENDIFEKHSYGEIKKWFLEQFKEFGHKSIDEILAA